VGIEKLSCELFQIRRVSVVIDEDAQLLSQGFDLPQR